MRMNFIRLPSLKLNRHAHEPLEDPIAQDEEKKSVYDPGQMPLPWKYKGQHHHVTTPPRVAPPEAIGPAESRGQSYAQEILGECIGNSHKSRRRRAPHSYASMIAQAILSSKERRMTLRDIYKWVQAHHGTHYDASVVGWQNSIRHNLSLNRCFYKVPKNKEKRKGKGGYWAVDLAALAHTTFGRHLLDTGTILGWEAMHMHSPTSSNASNASPSSNSSNSSHASHVSHSSNASNASLNASNVLPSSLSPLTLLKSPVLPPLPLQPADLASLQDHQRRFHQQRVHPHTRKRVVPLPTRLVIPTPAPPTSLRVEPTLSPPTAPASTRPMLHPPALHHILN